MLKIQPKQLYIPSPARAHMESNWLMFSLCLCICLPTRHLSIALLLSSIPKINKIYPWVRIKKRRRKVDWIIHFNYNNQCITTVIYNKYQDGKEPFTLVKQVCWKTWLELIKIFKTITKNNSITFKGPIKTKFCEIKWVTTTS